MAKAEQTRVSIMGGARGNTRYAVNQISSGGDNTNVTVSIRSTFGTRSASTTTNKLDDASLKSAVNLSERLAKLAPEDPESMPELGAADVRRVARVERGHGRARSGGARGGSARGDGAVARGEARGHRLHRIGRAGVRDRDEQGTVRVRAANGRGDDHHRARARRQLERMGGRIAQRLVAHRSRSARRARDREGACIDEPRGHRAGPVHRGARAHGGRKSGPAVGVRAERAQRGRGTQLLHEAGRRKQNRAQGRR